jgi:hypothetical protein
MNKNIFTLIVLAVFLFSGIAEAANQLIVVPAPGNKGVFYLKGVDFNDVSGVEVELEYDTAALANPRITQGSMLASTMFIPNPKFSAKSVKIAAMSLSPIKGSGDLAIITFDLKGSSPGIMTVARRTISTSAGTAVPTAPQTPSVASGNDSRENTGFIPGSVTNTPASATTASTATTTVVGGAGASVGTITLPQDQLASTESKPEYQPLVTDLRKDMSIPVGGPESPKTAGAKQTTADIKDEKGFVSYKSVLQLFKEFKGERNSKSLIALFADAEIADFSQVPAVAISDGKTPVKLTLILKPSGNESPKFFLQGANVKQLSAEGEDVKWIIDLLPKKGTAEAKLTVIDGKKMMEFPLIVAPAVDVALAKKEKLSEADFAVYLAKPSKFDLNKDSKFDAIDDYIFTANYIVAMKIKPEKLKAIDKEKDKKDNLKPEPKGEPAVKALPATEGGKKANTDKNEKK